MTDVLVWLLLLVIMEVLVMEVGVNPLVLVN